MQDFIGNITNWLMVTVLPAAALYGIRYLHILTQKTQFARNSELDDMVFKILTDEAEVFAGKIGRMEEAGKDGVEEVKREAGVSVLSRLKSRMNDQGINIAKKYGEEALNTMLHAAVHKIKKP